MTDLRIGDMVNCSVRGHGARVEAQVVHPAVDVDGFAVVILDGRYTLAKDLRAVEWEPVNGMRLFWRGAFRPAADVVVVAATGPDVVVLRHPNELMTNYTMETLYDQFRPGRAVPEVTEDVLAEVSNGD